MPEDTTLVVISTSVVALVTGFLLGIYSIQGYIITPEFAKQSRANYEDPVDSDETDIDEDETHMDHAPNWANGEEADRKQGLRYTGNGKSKAGSNRSKAGAVPSLEDTGEECKLILVVRTDLGMTKGRRADPSTVVSSLQESGCVLTPFFLFHPTRQDRSAVRPRDPRLLQVHLQGGARRRAQQPRGQAPAALGALRPGQGRLADQERRRDARADGQGALAGNHRRGHRRRRPHPDRPRQPDRSRRGARAQERRRPGHRPPEAAVGREGDLVARVSASGWD